MSPHTTRSTLAKTASPDLGTRGAIAGNRIEDRNQRKRKVSCTILHSEKCSIFSVIDTKNEFYVAGRGCCNKTTVTERHVK